jgi:hypothetical protein
MICNEYIGMYFFSAIFQGNMALLAFLGVFVVFKRQELMSELQGKDSLIVSFVQNYFDLILPAGKHMAFSYRSIEDLPNVIHAMIDNGSYPSNIQSRAKALHTDPNFNARYSERNQIITRRSSVLKLLVKPFWWILGIVIVSLLFLPFIHSIHLNYPILELLIVISTILANVVALFVTKVYVWKILKD